MPGGEGRDEVERALALLARGSDGEAYAVLRAHFAWPRGRDLDPGELAAWVDVLGGIAAHRGADPLDQLATAVVGDPDSPDRLYDLGYALIDAGVPGMAASVLWRCLALVGDSEEVVCELVSALESALAYHDAFALLGEHAALRERSFLCQYLYGFNAAMIGRLDVTRVALTELAPDTDDTTTMKANLEAIVARADRVGDTCALDDRDLRGWHYVLTGGLLTHQSPYGFDTPMHGRFALLRDSFARVVTGMSRLLALVRTTPVPCVYAPPGRSHEILARALAAKLGVPLAPWPHVGKPAPGLVALYDLAELGAADIARLGQRRAGQIVYAHASPWTCDSPLAPDVTTLLYQYLEPPWHGDERAIEAIADDLMNAAPLDDEELVADERERWDQLVARTWPLEICARARLWAGGPVPSNRFD